MKCRHCQKTTDFTIQEDRPGKTVKIVAVHKRGSSGPFLRDALLTRTYQTRLMKELAAECKAAT